MRFFANAFYEALSIGLSERCFGALFKHFCSNRWLKRLCASAVTVLHNGPCQMPCLSKLVFQDSFLPLKKLKLRRVLSRPLAQNNRRFQEAFNTDSSRLVLNQANLRMKSPVFTRQNHIFQKSLLLQTLKVSTKCHLAKINTYNSKIC